MNKKSQKGFTLLELMLALAIGIVVTVGIVKVFDGAHTNYRLISTLNQFEEQIAMANKVVTSEVKKAGYRSLDDILTGSSWEVSMQNIISPHGEAFPNSVLSFEVTQSPGVSTEFPYTEGSPALVFKEYNDAPLIEIYYTGDKEHEIRTCTGNLVPNKAVGVSVIYLEDDDETGAKKLMCKGGVYSVSYGITGSDSYNAAPITLMNYVNQFYVRGFNNNDYVYYNYSEMYPRTSLDSERIANTSYLVFEIDFLSKRAITGINTSPGDTGVSSGSEGRITRQTTFSVKLENPL